MRTVIKPLLLPTILLLIAIFLVSLFGGLLAFLAFAFTVPMSPAWLKIGFYIFFSALLVTVGIRRFVYGRIIIITDTALLLPSLFGKKVVPWNQIIDWAEREYSAQVIPRFSSTRICFLEIWYTDAKNKTQYHEQNISEMYPLDVLFSVLKEKANRTEAMKKQTRSFWFYIKEHPLYFAFISFIGLCISLGGVSAFLMNPNDGLIFLLFSIVFILMFFIDRNFFQRK